MKPLFNLVVVPSVEMSWIEDGGEKRKKKKKKQPHRNGGEKSGARGEKRHIKTAWGGGGGEGVGVLLEGGVGYLWRTLSCCQMESRCQIVIAHVFSIKREAWAGAPSVGTL